MDLFTIIIYLVMVLWFLYLEDKWIFTSWSYWPYNLMIMAFSIIFWPYNLVKVILDSLGENYFGKFALAILSWLFFVWYFAKVFNIAIYWLIAINAVWFLAVCLVTPKFIKLVDNLSQRIYF